jgi:hypothetical protein
MYARREAASLKKLQSSAAVSFLGTAAKHSFNCGVFQSLEE